MKAAELPSLLRLLNFRPVLKADLARLEWDGEYAHFRNLYADAYRSVEHGEALMWLAEIPGGRVVAQVFVSFKSSRPELSDGVNRAYVYGFRVRPAYRGQGIGTYLMELVEKDLRQRGFNKVTLNVSRDNPGARRLYERLGYRVTAPEAGDWYYIDQHGIRRDVHEPAWRMEKNLK